MYILCKFIQWFKISSEFDVISGKYPYLPTPFIWKRSPPPTSHGKRMERSCRNCPYFSSQGSDATERSHHVEVRPESWGGGVIKVENTQKKEDGIYRKYTKGVKKKKKSPGQSLLQHRVFTPVYIKMENLWNKQNPESTMLGGGVQLKNLCNIKSPNKLSWMATHEGW